ncbi:MAG: TolC family protein [Candidatus Eisenbacteria bacterium]|nr:TolC family protein [Candidatus Eisenbacteria bacterium]
MTVKRTSVFLVAVLLLLPMAAPARAAATGTEDLLRRIREEKPIRIEECVRVALETNPGLRSGRESVRSTERAVWESYSTFLPNLSFGLSGSRTKQASYTLYRPGIDEDKYNFYSSSIQLSQTLFSWSGIKGIHQARNMRDADRAGFEADRQSLVYQVRTGCHNLLKMEDLLDVALENLQVGQEQLKLAEKMKEVGAGVIADVLKASAQVESNRLDVITAEKNLAVARAALLGYMGLDVTLPIHVERVDEVNPEIPDFGTSLKRAMENRPDLREMEENLQASKDGVGAAWGSHLPSLNGSFRYGWNNDELSADLFDEERNNWTASISLSVPLFDVGTYSRIGQRKAGVESARWGLEATRQNVALEIQNAILVIEESAKKMEVAERNVAAADEDLRVSEGKYKHGLVAILDLIQAKASLAEAKAGRVEARYNYLSARAELMRAIGEGE